MSRVKKDVGGGEAFAMPDVFREAIAVHLILMAAGISAEDIYVTPGAVSPDGRPGQLGVVVRTPKWSRDLTITVGRVDMPVKEFEKHWLEAVRALHQMSDAEAKALRDGAEIRSHAVEILALVAERRR